MALGPQTHFCTAQAELEAIEWLAGHSPSHAGAVSRAELAAAVGPSPRRRGQTDATQPSS
jgi:hypothetical protein